MIKNDALVTFASWEDRFYLAVERTLSECLIEKIWMYYYKEYAKRTEDNRRKVQSLCAEKGIGIETKEVISEKPVDTWNIYKNDLNEKTWHSKSVLVDISTMPRESIWSIFYFLENSKAQVNYVYYQPEKYNEEWLSRDPGRPRLLFKHSGVAELGRPTVLMVITGFDSERTIQLINFFEPKLALLGIQTGKQFENFKKNLEAHQSLMKSLLKGLLKIETFEIDAYSQDHGLSIIEQQLKEQIKDNNIIMSSLGPKPSAVALYEVCRNHPEIALAYAPSKEFNINYSYGIGGKISGKL